MNKIKIGIIGGSGYTGLELLRLLCMHPCVEVRSVTSRSLSGKRISQHFNSLSGYYEGLAFTDPDPEKLCSEIDLGFLCVPHGVAMDVAPQLLERGVRIVDLSADFRLRDASTFENWYGEHRAKSLLATAVYGLSEHARDDVRDARLVANPGCYPTSVQLPLIPLLQRQLVSTKGIVIDSKSGASGAGRSPSLATLFCEVEEAFKAYKVCEHRHTPEIEQGLSLAAEKKVVVTFTPHLVPMTRGILSTIYVDAIEGVTTEDMIACLNEAYHNAPFVRVLEKGQFPNTASVKGSNFCDIGLKLDNRTGKAVIVSAIDNLVKGASGQAIQNMNIMFGLHETTGLLSPPLYP